MPKRRDIDTILLIGSGPIVIGQGCEFDYSGVQACKALKEEGYRVVLVNSNPATIMTDPDFADVTYVEPIHWETVARIIEKERPDALLPTMGGQTGLNCALDLDSRGLLKAWGVEMIGATREAIDKAEDRERFQRAMAHIGLEIARGEVAHSVEQANAIAERIGYPLILRPSFTLGGEGGGLVYNPDEFLPLCERGFEASPTHEILIEEDLSGWKEFELEVVRDRKDNAIVVCSIENVDPMGVHTGDSCTVAPAQTLTDKEYQRMRNASLAVLREIGIDTGGSNVQFAVDPKTGRMIVVEMNPRVSRSSALASKATGFPIAKVAAKLAVGYTLDELGNDITGGKTPASFEPSIDYVVTKLPRFDFEKFPEADPVLTSQMKSVGEVMAIGRTFQESLQKAMRSLEIDRYGLEPLFCEGGGEGLSTLKRYLRVPGADRLWYVGDAFRGGLSLEELHEMTGIDSWFLAEIEDLVSTEQAIETTSLTTVTAMEMRSYKRKGFSDRRLAALWGVQEEEVRLFRHKEGLRPVYKRVDSCAAEFPTMTAYMYSTYEEECEARPSTDTKILILGGGPNRIGQGIEFDYCCVHAAMVLGSEGFETIMVNCNPETVSTDYDIANRLYFEPLTLEDVVEIVHKENPYGVIVQYGGQTPLKLAEPLEKVGVPILGTSPASIHRAEDRDSFKQILSDLRLRQPSNATVRTLSEALSVAKTIGYPLIVRPSYVLGGRAMEIVEDDKELSSYVQRAISASHDSPVLLDRFVDDAIEVDVDAVCDGHEVLIGGVMEHIEEAGVHSGDSACSLPSHGLGEEIQRQLKEQTRQLALTLGVKGLMNVQFAIRAGDIFVLEVNPRASRTIPFVSKATSRPLAKVGALCMTGQSLASQGIEEERPPTRFSVKEPVFPFIKFPGVDTVLGPEMRSTGEVMGVGLTFGEAFGKAMMGAGMRIPSGGSALLSVKDRDKKAVVEIAAYLARHGFHLYATAGTAKVLLEAELEVIRVNKVADGRPHLLDLIKSDMISLIVNTTAGKKSLRDSSLIRRAVLEHKITYFTTVAGGKAACAAHAQRGDVGVTSLQRPLEGLAT